jgi:RNA polymerase sigma factor (TIGR02999 family)
VTAVYQHLRRIAAYQVAHSNPSATYQATELLHDAYQKLSRGKKDFDSERHLCNAFSEAMRHILIDRARSKLAPLHGGDRAKTPFEDAYMQFANEEDPHRVLDISRALDELSSRHRDVVRMRYFGGFTIEEIAEMNRVSASTMQTAWREAKVQLLLILQRYGTDSHAASSD